MSNDLDLYNREYYFYDVISKYVPIKYPKYYGLIKDENFDNIGVLLENLNTSEFLLNIDLNKEKINTSLTLNHKKYWEKYTDLIIKEISDSTSNICFVLMGNHAQSKKHLINSKKHHILECTHPSPNSASRGFFKSNIFPSFFRSQQAVSATAIQNSAHPNEKH